MDMKEEGKGEGRREKRVYIEHMREKQGAYKRLKGMSRVAVSLDAYTHSRSRNRID
jgi:hypothetical protein